METGTPALPWHISISLSWESINERFLRKKERKNALSTMKISKIQEEKQVKHTFDQEKSKIQEKGRYRPRKKQ